MKKIYVNPDFDVDELSSSINAIMSKWSIHLIRISGRRWEIYDYDGALAYEIVLILDFNDLETRIKLEDLRLNIIHHIESLKDETTYVSQMISSDMLS